MPLIRCPDCGRDLSADAPACPGCGKPNEPAVHRAQNARQRGGCALIIAALLAGALIHPFLGLALFAAGLILIALNTRFS